jgi:hypothetical protein
VAHVPVGFAGTVDQVAWAALMSSAAPRFIVAGPDHWTPTAVTTADRTVRVAAGRAWCCGVQDTTDTAYLATFAANTTASDRYDLLIARWTWTAGGGSVVTGVVTPGTPGAGVPSVSLLVRNPGVRYDALLAVVRVRPGVGQFTAADIADCRVMGGSGGPLVSIAGAYPDLVDLPEGGTLRLPATTGADPMPVRDLIRSGTGWRLMGPPSLPAVVAPWTNPPGDFGFAGDGYMEITRVTLPDPGFPYRVSARARCEMGAIAAGGTRIDMQVWIQQGTTWFQVDTAQGQDPVIPGASTGVSFQQLTTGITNQVFTGPTDVVVRAFRVYGLSLGRITGNYKHLTAARWAA